VSPCHRKVQKVRRRLKIRWRLLGPSSVGASQWAGKAFLKRCASSLGLEGSWALAAASGCRGEWNLPKRSVVVNIYLYHYR